MCFSAFSKKETYLILCTAIVQDVPDSLTTSKEGEAIEKVGHGPPNNSDADPQWVLEVISSGPQQRSAQADIIWPGSIRLRPGPLPTINFPVHTRPGPFSI